MLSQSTVEWMKKKKFIYKVGRTEFYVRIKEYKWGYGKDRLLITPVAGQGEKWVDRATLEEIAEAPKGLKQVVDSKP
jgi:hypothetical protein